MTIIGAHLDSISPSSEKAPGADDNASGIASLLALIRLLSDESASFESSVEFHFYAAEEVGLVGSSEIAQSYDSASVQVLAMMQIDMNFWKASAAESINFLLPTIRAQNWFDAQKLGSVCIPNKNLR